MGTGTALYAHGAYLSEFDGKPFSYAPRRVIILGTRQSRSGAGAGDGETFIDLEAKAIDGRACWFSEKTVDQPRRFGIRFDAEVLNGRYAPWAPEGPVWRK